MTTPQAKSSTVKRILIFVFLLIPIAAGLWWVLAKHPGSENSQTRRGAMPPVAVTVVTAMKKDVVLQLTALGTVTSANTVAVRSRVDGQLDKVHFTEGQYVEQNQLLAELDPRPYQAALSQAEGQLLRDQALLKNAQVDMVRYKQLLAEDSIAAQQVDTQKAVIQQYEGTVKLDQGLVENAKLQLVYSRILAPISGRVGLRQVDPGNIVKASDTTPLVTITQTKPIDLIFAVPEASLDQVLQAQRNNGQLAVEAWDRDRSKKLAEGAVLAVDNQLNTSTGTVNIKARFANDDNRLFPNQFVNVILRLGTQTGATTIPTAAVQLGKTGKYIFTADDDNTVHLTNVTCGSVSGADTVIQGGITPGQKVVADGLDKLRDGAKIEPIDPNKPVKTEKTGKSDQDSGNRRRASDKAQ